MTIPSSIKEINEILIGHQFVMLLPNMWPGDVHNPGSKVTSAATELPYAHEQAVGSKPRICLEKFTDAFFKSGLKNQSVDCSRVPKASYTWKNKYARNGVEREWGLLLKGEHRQREKGE